MAITRLGVCGPSAAYPGFTAKEEAAVVLAGVGHAALSTDAATATLSTDSATATMSTDAATAALEHDNLE
jgi:hypothetical protein